MKFQFSSSRRMGLRRAGATLLGAALCSLILSSCGGGGSSSPNTTTGKISANNTPTATASSSECSTTYTPNYSSSVTLLHWTSFPLKVYFTPDSNLTAARQKLAVQSFNRWVTATNNGVTYNVVTSADDADITVKFFVFTGGPGDTLGTTVVSYYPDSNTIDSANMSLGVTGDTTNDIVTDSHEFGHALGIYGHSPDDADLMYYTGNDTGCGCITASDLNTILTAYCGNFPHNANARVEAHSGGLKTVTID